jgi:hypothetical protein
MLWGKMEAYNITVYTDGPKEGGEKRGWKK